jgi:hypothetical protein
MLPGVVDAAVALKELHEGQRAFVRGEGHRARTRVGIDKQEVDSI